MSKWVEYQLPEDMADKTFLDVGCWEGVACREAVRKGAMHAVGVDMCVCDRLRRYVEEYENFDFMQMDIFSDRFIELDVFDVVLCAGVLYHVQNPAGLLVRLRKVVGEVLFLETALNDLGDDAPVMQFHPSNEIRKDASIWWRPNESCLMLMLEVCGFGNLEVTWRRVVNDIKCVCVRAEPVLSMPHVKMMPRKPDRMGIAGGERPRA